MERIRVGDQRTHLLTVSDLPGTLAAMRTVPADVWASVAVAGPDRTDGSWPRRRPGWTSTARGIPGRGIGLSGSKMIVEQHGGQITVESAVGQGTTVLVRLPGPCE